MHLLQYHDKNSIAVADCVNAQMIGASSAEPPRPNYFSERDNTTFAI
jgi:hypothetical protein